MKKRGFAKGLVGVLALTVVFSTVFILLMKYDVFGAIKPGSFQDNEYVVESVVESDGIKNGIKNIEGDHIESLSLGSNVKGTTPKRNYTGWDIKDIPYNEYIKNGYSTSFLEAATKYLTSTPNETQLALWKNDSNDKVKFELRKLLKDKYKELPEIPNLSGKKGTKDNPFVLLEVVADKASQELTYFAGDQESGLPFDPAKISAKIMSSNDAKNFRFTDNSIKDNVGNFLTNTKNSSGAGQWLTYTDYSVFPLGSKDGEKTDSMKLLDCLDMSKTKAIKENPYYTRYENVTFNHLYDIDITEDDLLSVEPTDEVLDALAKRFNGNRDELFKEINKSDYKVKSTEVVKYNITREYCEKMQIKNTDIGKYFGSLGNHLVWKYNCDDSNAQAGNAWKISFRKYFVKHFEELYTLGKQNDYLYNLYMKGVVDEYLPLLNKIYSKKNDGRTLDESALADTKDWGFSDMKEDKESSIRKYTVGNDRDSDQGGYLLCVKEGQGDLVLDHIEATITYTFTDGTTEDVDTEFTSRVENPITWAKHGASNYKYNGKTVADINCNKGKYVFREPNATDSNDVKRWIYVPTLTELRAMEKENKNNNYTYTRGFISKSVQGVNGFWMSAYDDFNHKYHHQYKTNNDEVSKAIGENKIKAARDRRDISDAEWNTLTKSAGQNYTYNNNDGVGGANSNDDLIEWRGGKAAFDENWGYYAQNYIGVSDLIDRCNSSNADRRKSVTGIVINLNNDDFLVRTKSDAESFYGTIETGNINIEDKDESGRRVNRFKVWQKFNENNSNIYAGLSGDPVDFDALTAEFNANSGSNYDAAKAKFEQDARPVNDSKYVNDTYAYDKGWRWTATNPNDIHSDDIVPEPAGEEKDGKVTKGVVFKQKMKTYTLTYYGFKTNPILQRTLFEYAGGQDEFDNFHFKVICVTPSELNTIYKEKKKGSQLDLIERADMFYFHCMNSHTWKEPEKYDNGKKDNTQLTFYNEYVNKGTKVKYDDILSFYENDLEWDMVCELIERSADKKYGMTLPIMFNEVVNYMTGEQETNNGNRDKDTHMYICGTGGIDGYNDTKGKASPGVENNIAKMLQILIQFDLRAVPNKEVTVEGKKYTIERTFMDDIYWEDNSHNSVKLKKIKINPNHKVDTNTAEYTGFVDKYNVKTGESNAQPVYKNKDRKLCTKGDCGDQFKEHSLYLWNRYTFYPWTESGKPSGYSGSNGFDAGELVALGYLKSYFRKPDGSLTDSESDTFKDVNDSKYFERCGSNGHDKQNVYVLHQPGMAINKNQGSNLLTNSDDENVMKNKIDVFFDVAFAIMDSYLAGKMTVRPLSREDVYTKLSDSLIWMDYKRKSSIYLDASTTTGAAAAASKYSTKELKKALDIHFVASNDNNEDGFIKRCYLTNSNTKEIKPVEIQKKEQEKTLNDYIAESLRLYMAPRKNDGDVVQPIDLGETKLESVEDGVKSEHTFYGYKVEPGDLDFYVPFTLDDFYNGYDRIVFEITNCSKKKGELFVGDNQDKDQIVDQIVEVEITERELFDLE